MNYQNFSPIFLTFLATLFTYGMTAAGAAVVFLFKTYSKKTLDGMLGFAAGVMIAASFWSLLQPSIELSRELGKNPIVPAAIGFITGGFFIRLIDFLLPHLHMGEDKPEGLSSSFKRVVLLTLAVTIHNIPEGLAVGVAFGALSIQGSSASLIGAITLALGIGIQNFPEGSAISLPLRGEGYSKVKSFFIGQLSGIVEPIFGILGAILVIYIKSLLPYALSFAAGAMIYVVVEELIPESQNSKNTDIATVGTLLGFTIMMILDVALG
ncbi:MAG: ZIP family metal transporter [Spirochaetales bacterium]|jgi:ZIP family zinc transporter|nr:ZIP family metal transporter [Exilispira sp.]NMC66797.1 ZIP family metal transporter [Spirochaetales bacterium]